MQAPHTNCRDQVNAPPSPMSLNMIMALSKAAHVVEPCVFQSLQADLLPLNLKRAEPLGALRLSRTQLMQVFRNCDL